MKIGLTEIQACKAYVFLDEVRLERSKMNVVEWED
jgi:hypothetical protein